MREIAKILYLIASIVSLCACVALEQKQITDINVNVGENFEVELPFNASTGYCWNITKLEPSIELIDTVFTAPKTNLIGASGTKTFRFLAKQKYTGEIVFEYKRPWENTKSPAKIKKISIIVR